MTRLTELLHRAVPYPVLLLTDQNGMFTLSGAHKRWAQNEADKVVLDSDVMVVSIDPGYAADWFPDFMEALAFDRQPRQSLRTVYQGWLNVMTAALAAMCFGRFRMTESSKEAEGRREALRTRKRLEAEIIQIRATARKERQTPRLVELNMELKRREKEMSAAMGRLK